MISVIDTHQHLWDLEQFPYSWCRNHPVLDRSFRLDDYLEATKGAPIVKTVFMECDVDDPHQLDEAAHIQSLANQNPLIAGIIAGCRPEKEGFTAHLDALERLPGVRGVRRVLHTMPDATSQSSLFVENLRQLARRHWTFDLCVLARQLPLAIALIEQCPDVSFVLDHCGVPDIKDRVFEPWRTEMARLAHFPNVVCKVSGLVAYADPETWTESDLRPWVEHVIAHFGWDRLLWGSDWPVCTQASSLQKWLRTAQSLVADANREQQENFFMRNAERIYRLR